MEDSGTAVVDAGAEQVVEDTQTQDSDQASQEKAPEIDKIDIDSLPEELKAMAKSLQADYTRKTQEISKIKSKADALDEIVAVDGFSEILANIEKYGTPLPPQQAARVAAEETVLTGEEIINKLLDDPKWLQQYVAQEAKKIVESEIGDLKSREVERYAEEQIKQLEARHPDWKEYEDAITELVSKKNYDLEDAYRIAAFDSAKKAGKSEAIAEKRSSIATPSSSRATQTVSPASTKSIRGAFEAAMRQHGM